MTALADWLGTILMPWSDLFSSSTALETAVVVLHLGGMLAAGGIAFTLDRAVLRSARHGWPARSDLAREIHEAHGAVIVGLAAIVLSGLALTAADPTVFLVSPIYWAKMLIVVFLLANGWFLKRAGERLLAAPDDQDAFRGLRASALRSGGLWAASLLGGVALTLYA
jgi:hypothetical protein